MPHVESAMYSTTWSILQHYRESVIMEDEDVFGARRPSSPGSRFQMGNPFESTKRPGANNNTHNDNAAYQRRYDFTPESLSPASPRSPRASSPEAGYASSQTSASSYNEKRKQQRREIRARRSPNGSQNWPADLKLSKTNGATQLDEPNLPRWKYSPRRMGREQATSPPPLPPKNKLRNSLQRFPSTGSDQGATGLRRRDDSRSPGYRPQLRVDIPDEPANMSLRQGMRRPSDRSRDDARDDLGASYRDENPVGKRKPSEQKQSHFSPDMSAEEYNPYANPFGPRKDSREQQNGQLQGFRRPPRDDSLGSIDAMMSPRHKYKPSVDSFGDPQSTFNRPRRSSTGSNYGEVQDLSKAVRNQLRSPSDYGSPAPPSSSYPKSSKRLGGMVHIRTETNDTMTFSNLATPFSQPEYGNLNPANDAPVFSPEEPAPLRQHRRNISDVSPRSGVPPGLPNPRREMQNRDEPQLNASSFRDEMGPSQSPPPPPPPPKMGMGLPAGPRDAAPMAPRGSNDASKPLPLKPNRRGPAKAELPKEPPKSFNMAPVAGLRRPSPARSNDRMANSPSPGPNAGGSLRQRQKGGKGNDRPMEISSPTLVDHKGHRDFGLPSPTPRYGGLPSGNAPMLSSRNNPYGNPYGPGPTPTGPSGGMRSNLGSDATASSGQSRNGSTRSGFSHQRNGSDFSSASSNNSIPVGTSAFGRLSAGSAAVPTSNSYRRGAPSPGPTQHLNVTSDAGLGGGPYPTSASRGRFPPKAPFSGTGRPTPSPGPYRQGPPAGMPSPLPNGRPLAGGNPRIGPPLPGHPGVGVTPMAHKRMASNFTTASGPGRVDQRRQDPNLAAAAMGAGPYPSSAPNSGGGRRNGPPLPGAPGGPPPLAQSGMGLPMGGPGPAPPGKSRGQQPLNGTSNGRRLPPGAGFGLPGVPGNIRAGVPGRREGIMRV